MRNRTEAASGLQGDAAGLHGDAAVLRAAARVMRRRSTGTPHLLALICHELERIADTLDAQAAADHDRNRTTGGHDV